MGFQATGFEVKEFFCGVLETLGVVYPLLWFVGWVDEVEIGDW